MSCRARRGAAPRWPDPASALGGGTERIETSHPRSGAPRLKSQHPAAGTAEWGRLQEVPRGRAPWRRWGPYLSERAWGTVREDYSADGDAWRFFPFDHARSRAYRWNEDGLAGICDDRQTLCLAFAFWNGRGSDPQGADLRPRPAPGQPRGGRQGVLVVPGLHPDPLVDALALHVPAGPVPLRGAGRGERAPGPAGSRVRAGRHRGLRRRALLGDHRRLRQGGPRGHPDRARGAQRRAGDGDLDLLPTLWFRNTWSWDDGHHRPAISAEGGSLRASHHVLGRRRLDGLPGAQPLFCDNETNTRRLWGGDGACATPRTASTTTSIAGCPTVNPEAAGPRRRSGTG